MIDYIMTKRIRSDNTPYYGYLILKTKDTEWKGIGYFCGYYAWCGYKNAVVVAKYFDDEAKVRVVNNIGDLIENVEDNYGSKTVTFSCSTQEEAVEKFITFLKNTGANKEDYQK